MARARRLPAGEKVAITKAARDLAKEMNEVLAEKEALEKELADERRRNNARTKARRNREKERAAQQANRRAARRNGDMEKRKCQGLNLLGKPCGQSPLIPARWDGPEEISGNFCLSHEPAIATATRIAFQQSGSAKSAAYRRVTPAEVAHELIQRSPKYFLGPYLKALGLELDEETMELKKTNMGLKLHGFSRGGEVVRSPYPDYTGQVQVVEKLLDRVYGKARQAVDLAAQNTTVAVNINMDVDRVSKVAEVLKNAGALPNGNGNGNGHIDISEADVVEDDVDLPHADLDA